MTVPKVTLEFSLPEEMVEHKNALNGGSWRYAIEELDDYLRGLEKYRDAKEVSIEEIRRQIMELTADLY